ncbi:MAG: protein kinase [Quadrisphaera sp.]
MSGSVRVLSGRYEVGELLGRGGMAEVHAGRDQRLDRRVAIKLLRSDVARDPVFLARFRREAQSTALLNHPGIVAVYDAGEDVPEGTGLGGVRTPYIVMELVEGRTVRDLLDDAVRAGQPGLGTQRAVEITAGVLRALQAAHDAGIVHRDVKPANVMVTASGSTKVMDFGIARALADSTATMTQTSAVIGTAQYLSPEQARGEGVDARTDLYSTGCLLHELLTGRPPFVGDSPFAVAYQHVRELPAPPSHHHGAVDEHLDRVVLTALSKDRDDRHADAEAFREDLLAVGVGAGRRTGPPGGATAATTPTADTTAVPTAQAPLRRGARRGHRGRAAALAVGVLAVVLALTGWLPGRVPDRESSGSASSTTTGGAPTGEQAPPSTSVVLTSADGPSTAAVAQVTARPQEQATSGLASAAAPPGTTSPEDVLRAAAGPAAPSAPAQTPSTAPTRSVGGEPTGASADAPSRAPAGTSSAPAPRGTPQQPHDAGAGQPTASQGGGQEPPPQPSQGSSQEQTTGTEPKQGQGQGQSQSQSQSQSQGQGQGRGQGAGGGAADGTGTNPGRSGEQQGQGRGRQQDG